MGRGSVVFLVIIVSGGVLACSAMALFLWRLPSVTTTLPPPTSTTRVEPSASLSAPPSRGEIYGLGFGSEPEAVVVNGSIYTIYDGVDGLLVSQRTVDYQLVRERVVAVDGHYGALAYSSGVFYAAWNTFYPFNVYLQTLDVDLAETGRRLVVEGAYDPHLMVHDSSLYLSYSLESHGVSVTRYNLFCGCNVTLRVDVVGVERSFDSFVGYDPFNNTLVASVALYHDDFSTSHTKVYYIDPERFTIESEVDLEGEWFVGMVFTEDAIFAAGYRWTSYSTDMRGNEAYSIRIDRADFTLQPQPVDTEPWVADSHAYPYLFGDELHVIYFKQKGGTLGVYVRVM